MIRKRMLLQLGNVSGLRPFLAFDDFEFDLVTLLQALVAFGTDRAVMNKNIGAILAPDETKSFCIIEPLDRSLDA